jgi:uncharacterized membrane protein (UPF0127 family)
MKRMSALLCLTGLACSASGNAEPRPASTQEAGATTTRAVPMRGTAWVIFGSDTVVAEVARTADERAQGLMNREAVPDGTGMLFVFDEPDVRSFWMRDTFVALDVAFMDSGYRITEIQQMEPETTELHTSKQPALVALEVRKGWFAEHGIGPGDRAEIVFGAR